MVLKLSGEALASAASDETIDASTVDFLAVEIAAAMERGGLELAVVVGGGNIWRGATGELAGMNRANSDLMGMLGTVINSLALQDAMENHGRPTRVMSAIDMNQVAEPYIRRRAVRHLEKGRVVIFAAGMGNPYFTTDTPAAQRAAGDRGRDCAEGHSRRRRRRLLRRPSRQPERREVRRDLL